MREAGGLFIADEVQPGFARTGKRCGGLRVTASSPTWSPWASPWATAILSRGRGETRPAATFGATTGYFNTFGGNSVAAAAGLAVLETIEAEKLKTTRAKPAPILGLASSVPSLSASLASATCAEGDYIGVELVRDRKSKKPDRETATRVVDMLRERNVLVGIAGPYGNVLKIRPPLSFGQDHADILVKALSELRSRVYRKYPLPLTSRSAFAGSRCRADLVENGRIVDGGRHGEARAVGDLLHGAAQNFARAGLGQARHDHRGLERGDGADPFADETDHLFLDRGPVAVDAGLEHEEADRHFALPRVGRTDHGALGHVFVGREHLLHRARR